MPAEVGLATIPAPSHLLPRSAAAPPGFLSPTWSSDLAQGEKAIGDEYEQIAHAYGQNARLRAVKTRFDPDGIFSATPLPPGSMPGA